MRLKVQKKKYVLFLVLFMSIMFIVVEGSVRLMLHVKRHYLDRDIVLAQLGSYKMQDPDNVQNYFLIPGFRQTVSEYRALALQEGRKLGIAYVDSVVTKYGLDEEYPILGINKAGFKGPEVRSPKPKIRLMTVGNSCTEGSWIDILSYPRSMELQLKKRLGSNIVEVINAGVSGYGDQNVIWRLPYFLSFKPDFVTIHIGWNNGVYGEPIPHWTKYLEMVRVPYLAIWRIRTYGNRSSFAVWPGMNSGNLIYNATNETKFDDYIPLDSIGNIVEIIQGIKQSGASPVLCTLPGLFTTSSPPDSAALAKGHLPLWTRNAYVIAKITEQYNERLRHLAEDEGIMLLDLEAWADTAFVPRSHYFNDGVHLTEKGQQMLGLFMASELVEVIAK
jgi:lysophospholipase L1-like esterase